MAGDCPSIDFAITEESAVRRVIHVPSGMTIVTLRVSRDAGPAGWRGAHRLVAPTASTWRRGLESRRGLSCRYPYLLDQLSPDPRPESGYKQTIDHPETGSCEPLMAQDSRSYTTPWGTIQRHLQQAARSPSSRLAPASPEPSASARTPRCLAAAASAAAGQTSVCSGPSPCSGHTPSPCPTRSRKSIATPCRRCADQPLL